MEKMGAMLIIVIIIILACMSFGLKQANTIGEYHQERKAFTIIQKLNR